MELLNRFFSAKHVESVTHRWRNIWERHTDDGGVDSPRHTSPLILTRSCDTSVSRGLARWRTTQLAGSGCRHRQMEQSGQLSSFARLTVRKGTWYLLRRGVNGVNKRSVRSSLSYHSHIGPCRHNPPRSRLMNRRRHQRRLGRALS